MTSLRDEIVLRARWLDGWKGHATLVEPTIGSTVGAPDASLVADHFLPGWVEFKAMDEEGRFKMRPEQRAWARSFLRYSRRCALVVMDKEGFYIVHIREVVASTFQPSYHAPSLPSLWPLFLWETVPLRDWGKILELCYVSSQ